MEEIKELAKCVKCNEFSEVDTDIALMSNPPQYQFTCSSCSNKQFIWGSFIYRIPRSILAKADDYEAKAKAWDRTQELLEECTHQTPGDDYEVDWHEFEMKIDDIVEKYESGESE